MTIMKSSESSQKCLKQEVLNKDILNKENISPIKTTLSMSKEGIHLKRSKSLSGIENEQNMKFPIIKQELKTTLMVPNKGILKRSLCSSDSSYDSSYKNNMDNHTVIGIMQVALKEDSENDFGNELKKSQKLKSLNRRESLLNNSPKTPSPMKCISPVKSPRLYISSPISISQGDSVLDDLGHYDSEVIKDLYHLDFQESVFRNQFLKYKNNLDSKDTNQEMTMDLTEIISNPVFEGKNHTEMVMNMDNIVTDPLSEDDLTEETMSLTKIIPESVSQGNKENFTVHLKKAIDNLSFEKDDLGEEKMDLTLAFGKIHTNKNIINNINFQSGKNSNLNKNQDILIKKNHQFSEPLETKSMELEDSVDFNFLNNDTDSDRDITEIAGTILKRANEINQDDGLTMDFTTAIGNVISINDKIKGSSFATFSDICSETESSLMQKSVDHNTFSNCFSHDDHKSTVACDDNNMIDMDLTGTAPCILELNNNPASKKNEKIPILDQSNDITIDMDMTKLFDTTLKSPQRVLRNGALAVDALFGKKVLNTNNMRRISDTFVPIQLGSPKAVELLKSRKSMSGFEEMKLAGLGDPTNKIVLGKKLTWGNEVSKIDTSVLNSFDIKNRIIQLTPKKNDALSQFSFPQNVLKSSISQDSGSELKRSCKNILNSTYVLSPPKKFCNNSLNFKKNEYSDHLIGMQDENDFLSPITLTEFLKMTSISFLDGLTTTRRRETVFFSYLLPKLHSLKELIYTASLTLPVLELYQFSCKELQKYIEEGKEVISKIEEDTSEENPLLFREYMSATHDIQVIMDGQFKLLKNYSRLYAKGVWYEWRDKLLLGLEEGLQKNLEGLKKDELVINEAKLALNACFPLIKLKFESLKGKLNHLKMIKEEINQCDQKELREVWSNISKINEEIESNADKIENINKNISKINDQLNRLSEKQMILDREIEEYKKATELNRCFDEGEIKNIKRTLKILKTITGWEAKSFSYDTVVFIYLDAPPLISRIWYTATLIWSEFCLLKVRYPILYNLTIKDDQPLLEITTKVFLPLCFLKIFVTFKLRHSIVYEYPNLNNNDFIDINVIYGNVNISRISKIILDKISTGGIKALITACSEF
ncbi:hypothetical protein PMAC_000895 [Pneumocystis sp. 'macacae']|nr:hypothetical protein PMAC_000895 [Pneumocystis sp. 'macacae']